MARLRHTPSLSPLLRCKEHSKKSGAEIQVLRLTSPSLKRGASRRFFGEYCQTQGDIVVEMEVEHIQPTSKGGKGESGNLCLSCGSCNGFKSNFTHAADPQTQEIVPLYNPRLPFWDDHFIWSEDGLVVIGLTAIGRATVQRLNMNNAEVIVSRRRWVSVGWHPPT